MYRLLVTLMLTSSLLGADSSTEQTDKGFFSAPLKDQYDMNLLLYYASFGDDPAAQKEYTDAKNNPKNPKANPNICFGPHGQACLHTTASFCTVEMFKHLIELGADVDQADKLGRRPLHYAVLTCNLLLVMLLLQAGADATLKDSAGNLPIDHLKHATATGVHDKKLIEKLLRP